VQLLRHNARPQALRAVPEGALLRPPVPAGALEPRDGPAQGARQGRRGRRPLVLPEYDKVAWYCYREAAVVHKHPAGMGSLASCYYHGRGVTADHAQAAFWSQKVADLGDAAAKHSLGAPILHGDPRAGVAQDAARGFALLREVVEQGCGMALYKVARCYLRGEGVEKDVAHGVNLLRQVIGQDDATKSDAEIALAVCYMEGNGVEVDTVQAAVWCQRAVSGGNAYAIENLRLIRECDFCGTTPARQLCVRCLKVRYCDRQCQLAHGNREINPHKGPCKEHCRRAAEASQPEASGASTSAHHL